MSITGPTRPQIAFVLFVSRIGRRFFRWFVNDFDLRGEESVLDFGSGWGDNEHYIAKKLRSGGRVTALDISGD
jgi:cyclopropane fatty-acyl-phospholipid synthase-like methyltransferase